MIRKPLIALWAVATLVVGKTPSGFTPASDTDLIVVYGQTPAMNGVAVDKAATASAPIIATTSRLTGTSYTVVMVDLDIPSEQNPHTFLHWMQTGLTPATTATTILASNGSTQAFTLSNAKNTSALVAYTQPAPPAENPLSHRYTQILIDTSTMSSDGLSALQFAAETRVGFDTDSALEAAGLSSNVVAGNSFNVTNPGQAVASLKLGNSTSSQIGSEASNDQTNDQRIKSNNGTRGFGTADVGGGSNAGGTLTSTISSAPAGATANVANAGTDGSSTSAALEFSRRDSSLLMSTCIIAVFVLSL
ncbi:hypothetical protein J7T55_009770 [Diaporthe amygdali]|uniref:uncharacterized protein n=1 Tax=Phomopsis amygdali TaxID=1214568 RepID=UPI0022FE1D25|nr:uncharacterized protein J7T55_009770 [Diaporthe amygdali]KAJ0116620.1 hypothetical protein J7T55_009770 [Diaporthe amygdali]